MAVYFVTGKLGSGKTLCAVGRIRDKLNAGLPVATNLDLKLYNLISPKSKNALVYRLPDKPKVVDFKMIGKGNTTYDEEKNGLIVLDECGTWFNSRTWNDKSRQEVINYLLHIRKLGWDVIFIVQDIHIVDKQARMALAELVVYCRRLDKMKIPFLTFAFSLVGIKFNMPKLHMALVKYGDSQASITVDRWWYFGHDLYDAYDTKQVFKDDIYNEAATYQVIPPYYTHYRYRLPITFRKIMRLTKIHFKRHKRTKLIFWGFVSGFLSSTVYAYYNKPEPVIQPDNLTSTSVEVSSDSTSVNLDANSLETALSNVAKKNIVDYNFDKAFLTEYYNFSDTTLKSVFFKIRFLDEDVTIHSDKLKSLGFIVLKHSSEYVLLKHPDSTFIYVTN